MNTLTYTAPIVPKLTEAQTNLLRAGYRKGLAEETWKPCDYGQGGSVSTLTKLAELQLVVRADGKETLQKQISYSGYRPRETGKMELSQRWVEYTLTDTGIQVAQHLFGLPGWASMWKALCKGSMDMWHNLFKDFSTAMACQYFLDVLPAGVTVTPRGFDNEVTWFGVNGLPYKITVNRDGAWGKNDSGYTIRIGELPYGSQEASKVIEYAKWLTCAATLARRLSEWTPAAPVTE